MTDGVSDGCRFEQQLLEAHPRLLRYLRAHLHDDQEAEDIASTTIERALRYRDTFDPSRPLLPWLLTIARRVIWQRERDLRVETAALLRLAMRRQPAGAHVRDPAELYAEAHLSDEPDMVLKAISDKQAELLGLIAFNDCSPQEAGRRLGLHPEAAKSLASRAKASYRRVKERGQRLAARWGVVALAARASSSAPLLHVHQLLQAGSHGHVVGVTVQAVGLVTVNARSRSTA